MAACIRGQVCYRAVLTCLVAELSTKLSFPPHLSLQLEEKGNPYTDGGGSANVLLRVNLLSLQTLPLGMRSIPRFDYQNKHLIRAR